MVTLVRFTLTIGIVALIAACGGSQPPIGAPGAMPQSKGLTSSSYRVLYRFHPLFGKYPAAGLVDAGGTLYGATGTGGAHHDGSVYAITTEGSANRLFSFRGASGSYPGSGSLLDVNGTLYGTTSEGGVHRLGTVYSISTTGSETLLFSFGGSDGALPEAGLFDVNGTLYGTTAWGGDGTCRNGSGERVGCGTVFSISTSGTEKVLYRFKGKPDGVGPSAALIDVDGTLYGTTYGGGTHSAGTVYSVTRSGVEKVLYSFAEVPDGARPAGALIDVGGTLYGTTTLGGVDSCSTPSGRGNKIGCGTVYSVTTGGSETVLYRFAYSDGADPESGLINVNGTLYGTTSSGGSNGDGTVYSISTSGAESVLYNFTGSTDGSDPTAPLLYVKGRMYGTTLLGGYGRCRDPYGCGTVFALTP